MTFDDMSHKFVRRIIAIRIDDESKINKFTKFTWDMDFIEPKKYEIGNIVIKALDNPQVIICKPIMCKMLHIEIVNLSDIDFEQKHDEIHFDLFPMSSDYYDYCMSTDHPVDEYTYRWGTNDDIDDFGDH